MKRAMSPSLLLLLHVSSALGCNGTMLPGHACGSCHGLAAAPAFGAAGTVYAGEAAAGGAGLEGATLEITDDDGQTVSLVTNEAGNFYTTTILTPPLQVTVSSDGARASMSDAPTGDCNRCHVPDSALAPGHIYVR